MTNNYLHKMLFLIIIVMICGLFGFLWKTNKLSYHHTIIFLLVLLIGVFVLISIYLFKNPVVNGDHLHCSSCDVKVDDDNKKDHGQCKLVYVCDDKDKDEHFTAQSGATTNTSSGAVKPPGYNAPKQRSIRTTGSPNRHVPINQRGARQNNVAGRQQQGASNRQVTSGRPITGSRQTGNSGQVANNRQEILENRQELLESRQEKNQKRIQEMHVDRQEMHQTGVATEHVQKKQEEYHTEESQEQYQEHNLEQDSEQDPEQDNMNNNRPDGIAEKDYWRTRYGTNNNYDSDFGGMFYDENPFYNRYNNNEGDEDYIESREELEDMRRRELRENARLKRLRADVDEQAYGTVGYETPYQKVGVKSEKHRVHRNRRGIEGPLDDELPYSDYNHLPVGAGYKSTNAERGYSFLPPEKWYPQPPVPPVCVTEKRCPVCPVMSDNSVADLKDFGESRRITQPDNINVAFINDKLNGGR